MAQAIKSIEFSMQSGVINMGNPQDRGGALSRGETIGHEITGRDDGGHCDSEQSPTRSVEYHLRYCRPSSGLGARISRNSWIRRHRVS